MKTLAVLLLLIIIIYSQCNFIEIPQMKENDGKIINEIIKTIKDRQVIYTINFDQKLDYPVVRVKGFGNFKSFIFERMTICVINLKQTDLQNFFKYLDEEPNFSPRAKYILIAHKLDDNVLKIACKYYATNLIIVQSTTTFIWDQPFRSENVNKCDLTLKKWNASELYVYKIPKLWRNTTVDVLLNPIPPYTMCTQCEDKGIELNLLEIIAKKLEFKINYIDKGFMYWGLKANGSYNGFYGHLKNREADLGIGILHSKSQEHEDFDLSFNHAEDETHWLVPAAHRLPYWKRLRIIFTIWVYVAIFVCAIVISLLVYYFYNYPFFATLFMLFEVLIEMSVGKTPKFRILFIFWAFNSLIISTVFKSKLMEILSGNHYEHQIDSLQDIEDSGLPVWIDLDFLKEKKGSMSDQEKRIWQKIVHCTDPWYCINRTAYKQDMITIDFMRTHEYKMPNYVDSNGDLLNHLIKEDIFKILIHLFAVKGYPIFPQIDRYLILLKSHGVIYLYYDRAENYAKMKLTKKTFLSSGVLSLKQMQIAFIIWLMGLILSVFVLILECGYKAYTKN